MVKLWGLFGMGILIGVICNSLFLVEIILYFKYGVILRV